MRSTRLLGEPGGWNCWAMDGFDPETSFGPDVAQRYDDDLRGDEEVSAAFLAKYAR